MQRSNGWMLRNQRWQGGFTLLEMAIVLVIIGLIAGGIMVGKSLIRSSQLQAVIGEYDAYVKAVKEFQDKYQALPGDMVGAQALWGTDSGGCPNTPTNNVAKIATCDGDGSGTIGSSATAAPFGAQTNTGEWFRAWQHLANAGLISGAFTGAMAPGVTGIQQGNNGGNVPASKLQGGGWLIHYLLYPVTTNVLWGDQYGHLLDFGVFTSPLSGTAPATTLGTVPEAPILTPAEALALDKKIDDGKPGRGIVRVDRPGYAVEANCTVDDLSTITQDSAIYNTSYSATACDPFFILGF